MDRLSRLSLSFLCFLGCPENVINNSEQPQKQKQVCIYRKVSKFQTLDIILAFFSDHWMFFCKLVSETEWHYEDIFELFVIKLYFTDSNKACQRYSYNLDEGRNGIWLETAIYPECIGLIISNSIPYFCLMISNCIPYFCKQFHPLNNFLQSLVRKVFNFSLHIRENHCKNNSWKYSIHIMRNMQGTNKFPDVIFYRKGNVFEWNGVHICLPK